MTGPVTACLSLPACLGRRWAAFPEEHCDSVTPLTRKGTVYELLWIDMVMPRVFVQRAMGTCLISEMGLCINYQGVAFEFVLGFQYGAVGMSYLSCHDSELRSCPWRSRGCKDKGMSHLLCMEKSVKMLNLRPAPHECVFHVSRCVAS